MRSARSLASFTPSYPMDVPGTVFRGFAMNRSSVFAFHVMPERFIASEYANPGTVPARLPINPQ